MAEVKYVQVSMFESIILSVALNSPYCLPKVAPPQSSLRANIAESNIDNFGLLWIFN